MGGDNQSPLIEVSLLEIFDSLPDRKLSLLAFTREREARRKRMSSPSLISQSYTNNREYVRNK